MLFLIWSVVLIVALILYFKQTYSIFKKLGVNGPTPVPLLGNGASVMLRREHIAENLERIYQTYSKENRFYGAYEFLRPMIVVTDLDLIKQITVKDFEHFLDHRTIIDGDFEPLFGRNLFSLKGQEWKDMRSTLSPAFTSSKIRLMVPFMVEVGNQIIDSFKRQIKESDANFIEIEGKDVATRYANDVVASCAFGLKVDSVSDETNEFYKMGKAITSFFGVTFFIKMFLFIYMPFMAKILNLKFLPETVTTFFRSILLETMDNREKNNIVRPDMIHLLMQAKKGKLVHEEKSSKDVAAGFATVEESAVGTKTVTREWSDDDLIAQAVLFFLAGFETVSLGMSFTLYELTCNPDIQDRLVKEIRENEAKNGGKLDFTSIQNMVYMDMVVSEALRLWAPAVAMDRLCTKDYNLGRPNDTATKDYIMQKGSFLQIPVWAIHRDPNFFPNPTKFDPERFSDENKHNIKPFTYVPFGLGPRNCIGSRFALCEIKVMVYQLLQHFELSPCERTCIPPKLSMKAFNFSLEGGNWFRLKIRQ